jgi:hypothetical protein
VDQDKKDALDRVQFLYQSRMTLFNTRRDHEWKIYFGVISLVAAMDAAFLTNHIHLTETYMKCCWLLIDGLLVGASVWYEWELQGRNSRDRIAMNNEVCDALDIECIDVREEKRHQGLWAFWCQVLVLAAVLLFSAPLPWVV